MTTLAAPSTPHITSRLKEFHISEEENVSQVSESRIDTTKEEEEDDEEINLEEINKTLTFDYMYSNAPFELLPTQYFPDNFLRHRPPIFIYGVLITIEKLKEYGRSHGIIPKDGTPPKRGWMALFYGVGNYLTKLCQLPERTIIYQTPVRKHKNCLVYTFLDNYTWRLPEDKRDQFDSVIETMEKELGGRGMWYLSYNKEFKDDYSIMRQ